MSLPDEYVLVLRTGERIEVSEFAYERIPALGRPGVAEEIEDVLRGCAVLTREAVEDAKRGNDVELRRAVRSPEAGLLKIARPECASMSSCAMADRRVCTTRNLSKRKRIPPCWEHSGDDDDLRRVVTEIVLAWAAGRRVIVVLPRTPQEAPSGASRPWG